MKVKVRQIARAATGSAGSHARNAMHWISERPVASATLLTGRLSPKSQERLWVRRYFLGRAKKHGLLGMAIASLLVGTTIALNHLLGLHVNPGDPMTGAAIGVLGTVITFFAVSTLAVSVSLTLLQTASQMWPARIMDSIFTEDHDREFLLQTIYMAFLVSLANLALLAAGLVHPLPALGWPVLLAFLTLMLMVAYVFDRVPLFSSTGLIAEITRRFEHQFTLLGDVHSNPQEARFQALSKVGDIFAVALSLAKDKRGHDARDAIIDGFGLMERLLDKQTAPGFRDRLGADPENPRWCWNLSLVLEIADSACAEAAAIDGARDISYSDLVDGMLCQLSGIAIVDLSWAHLGLETWPSSAEKIRTFGVLTSALLEDSQSTGTDDNPAKIELLKAVASKVRWGAEYLSGLDDGATGLAGGLVNAINWVRFCFSPDEMDRPEFIELSSWIAELETSLSPEQSARLGAGDSNFHAHTLRHLRLAS